MNTRTIVTLGLAEKRWLEQYSRRHQIPGAEVIRRALRQYRQQAGQPGLRQTLRETAGAWKGRRQDGLMYVESLRDECERRK